MKKLSLDFKYLISLWVVLTCAIVLTLFHHGHVLIDCGREVYYPVQILQGKVLYKELFNIYGPFSYMLNAVLLKFLGSKLAVFYSSGIICSFIIVTGIYLISKNFLNHLLSFSIGLLTISMGVLNLHLFNFIFPYSYAVLYGQCAFLLSFWWLLRYIKESEKPYYFYLSCFFAGMSATSKYEFLPYVLVIFYVALKAKSLKFEQYLLAVLALLAVPIICFGILFLQGLELNHLIVNFGILKQMANSQTLNYFYHNQGIYFSKLTFLLLLKTFVAAAAAFFLMLFSLNSKNKIILIISLVCSIVIVTSQSIVPSLAFVPVFVLIFSFFSIKNLKNNFQLQLLVACTLLLSAKIFCGLLLVNYGVFFASFVLISCFSLLVEKFKENKKLQLVCSIYVLILALMLGRHNLDGLGVKQTLINTKNGNIYTSNQIAPSTNDLIGFIGKNTKKTDSVVIFPEGLLINFLTERKSDNYYNSLIPLYWEVFGDEKLIKHFSESKPEYIIFNSWDNSDYYLKYICSDYAISFCNFVAKNYTLEKTIESSSLRYLIFKKKP